MSDLEQRAVAAAVAVAAVYGLASDQAVVIHSGSNVLVHLRPAPVVARVMTGTVVLHDNPPRWLTREISVVQFLAPSGLAVAPSQLIAPGPHHYDGLWMTFSEWVFDLEPTIQLGHADRLGRALRDLHDCLRPFDGDLGDLREVRGDIERLHGQLRAGDAQEADVVRSLRAQLDALGQAVFESTLPRQALHGDVSLSNLLRTPQRLLWNDFEDTFRGPVHWDLASLAESLRLRGASPDFIREMLDAYGFGDERELAPSKTSTSRSGRRMTGSVARCHQPQSRTQARYDLRTIDRSGSCGSPRPTRITSASPRGCRANIRPVSALVALRQLASPPRGHLGSDDGPEAVRRLLTRSATPALCGSYNRPGLCDSLSPTQGLSSVAPAIGACRLQGEARSECCRFVNAAASRVGSAVIDARSGDNHERV